MTHYQDELGKQIPNLPPDTTKKALLIHTRSYIQKLQRREIQLRQELAIALDKAEAAERRAGIQVPERSPAVRAAIAQTIQTSMEMSRAAIAWTPSDESSPQSAGSLADAPSASNSPSEFSLSSGGSSVYLSPMTSPNTTGALVTQKRYRSRSPDILPQYPDAQSHAIDSAMAAAMAATIAAPQQPAVVSTGQYQMAVTPGQNDGFYGGGLYQSQAFVAASGSTTMVRQPPTKKQTPDRSPRRERMPPLQNLTPFDIAKGIAAGRDLAWITGISNSAGLTPAIASYPGHVPKPRSWLGNGTQVPPTEEIGPLVSAYQDELGRVLICDALIYAGQEISPFAKLAFACLAARYLPNSGGLGARLCGTVWQFILPTLRGEVPPTVEVCQGLLAMCLYLVLSADGMEVHTGTKLFKRTVSLVKQLKLDQEPFQILPNRTLQLQPPETRVFTRDAYGKLIEETNVKERRALLWTIYCLEQQIDIQGGGPGELGGSEIFAGLPIPEDAVSNVPESCIDAPFSPSVFQDGLGMWESIQLARVVFLHYIIRRGMDLQRLVQSENAKVDLWGNPVLHSQVMCRPDVRNEQKWIRDSLDKYMEAEEKYGNVEEKEIGGVFVVSQRKMKTGMPADFAALDMLKIRLTTKRLLSNGLQAVLCAPRADIDTMFCADQEYSDSLRKDAKRRLTSWFTFDAFANQLAKAYVETPDAVAKAAENVRDCYKNLKVVGEAIQELLKYGDGIFYIHPVLQWCVWMCSLLDMTCYLLGPSDLARESKSRLDWYEVFFDNHGVKEAWPVMMMFCKGFGRQLKGTKGAKKFSEKDEQETLFLRELDKARGG